MFLLLECVEDQSQNLIVCFLISEGFKEAADKFGLETGISYPYDSESLNERIKIRESIENGCIEQAINLINNMHPDLIDNNRYLAFRLQVSILFSTLNIKHSIVLLIKREIFSKRKLEFP